MERPKWDEYFLEIAKAVSTRATCSRAQVGAIFVRNNVVIATGYNSPPNGMPHCNHECDYWNYNHTIKEGKNLTNGHCNTVIHAEINAVISVVKTGVSLQDCWLYCTHEPCLECSKVLIQIGCLGIKWIHDKEDSAARELRNKYYNKELI